MSIDISALERFLAEHKVYDAWQYVKSLQETLGYMSVSYNMLTKVHDHRVTTLAAVEQDIIHQAHETGEGRCTSNDVDRTNLVTRMSSTRQKINLCKSRNPKLSIDSDSLGFLFLL